MKHSLENTSPVTLTTSVDATNLVKLRQQFKTAGGDAVPSYTDILVTFAGVALCSHPALTVRWEGDKLVSPIGLHIGIAVNTEAGLLVPVIRDADVLEWRELAARLCALIPACGRGRFRPPTCKGASSRSPTSCFTASSAIMLIINYPECAILGVGRIQKLPAVVGDEIVALIA